MSDLEISGSDSEPVSDVDPEEMARLVADLDDMDNDLFKSTLKSASGGSHGVDTKKQDAKDLKRRVTFNEKPSPAKAAGKASYEDDDWDADDILNSDDEAKPQGKPSMKRVLSEAPPSPGKAADSKTKGKDPNEVSSKKIMAKSKLMADLFNDESQDATKGNEMFKSPISSESKKDKSKLMADLFGDGDSSNPDKSVSPIGKELKDSGGTPARQGITRKAKDDITFDDDDGDLLGGLGESKKNSDAAFDSSKGGSFLNSLLSKSRSSDYPKMEKEKPAIFVLDDKYKNMTKDSKNENSGAFGEYAPSASKPNSPHRRTPKKSVSNDNFDIFEDSEPRKRNPRSASQKKAFKVDDDDILGNIRSRRGGNKEVKDTSQTDTSSRKIMSDSIDVTSSSPAKVQNKDEWLFGSPGGVSESFKKSIDEASVMASIEQQESSIKKSSPSKSQDWLGNLLSTKKSPIASKQPVPGDDSAGLKQPKAASPTVVVSASSDTNLSDNSHSVQSFPVPAPSVTSSPFTAAPLSTATPTVPTVTSTMTTEGLHFSQEMQHQFLKQQQEAQAQATSFAAQLKLQQDQIEMQVALKLQEQQHHMIDLMKRQQEAAMKRNQEALLAVSLPDLNLSVAESHSDMQYKSLEVDLKTAEVEVARLKAELDLVRKQHAEEVAMLEEGYRRKMDMEKEIRDQVEKRLREERDNLLSDFQSKISLVQEEKEGLASSYDVQLANVKSEWSQAVERTKEIYTGMVERMKEEHNAALERMVHLKELEVKAAMSASGHVREVEAMMTQLESNTSNLSEITASINTRHDSALELTKRALKIKEKQLVDFEAHLAASRAEAENERARLNTLIRRLENTLVQQGSEVEKERWRLAQEQLKIEVERQGLADERKHLQMNIEIERQNLTNAREKLMSEHRSLLQSVAQQKHELATQQAHFTVQQKLAQSSAVGTNINTGKMNMMDVDAEMSVLSEEHRHLREKMAAVSGQEQHLKEEEIRMEQLSLQLEQEKIKLQLEQDIITKDQKSLMKTREEVEAARQEVNNERHEQQARLQQITSETRTCHVQQEKLENERLKLQHLREEVVRLARSALCPSCQTKGAEFLLDYTRISGDDGEGHNTSLKFNPLNRVNVTPSSVLARLAAARQQENMDREKRLLELSALEPS